MNQYSLLTNEVRFEISDGEIVGCFNSLSLGRRRDNHATTVFSNDRHTLNKVFSFPPTLSSNPPRMIVGRFEPFGLTHRTG